MTLSLLIVDDHQVLREGLRALLGPDRRFQIIGEGRDGLEAVKLAGELAPDVVVMDIAMPRMNGIEATRAITSKRPEVRVVALSAHSDRRYVLNMLEAGAKGYVVKSSACSELVQAIDAVARGESYLSPAVAGAVLRERVPAGSPRTPSAYSELAPREREVLQMLAEGRTSPEIATQLSISPRTVETHRRNMMRKLGLRSIATLTKYAIREGLTSVER